MSLIRIGVSKLLEMSFKGFGSVVCLLALGCLLCSGCAPTPADSIGRDANPNSSEMKSAAVDNAASAVDQEPGTEVEVADTGNQSEAKEQESAPIGSPTPPATTESNPTRQSNLGTQADDQLLLQKTVRAGVEYLLQKGQADDGSFSKQLSPAVTALCTNALLNNRVPLKDPRIQKSLKYLEGMIQADGGIYARGSSLRNYETSVSLMCFRQANTDGQYDLTIEKALGFLKGIQWDDG